MFEDKYLSHEDNTISEAPFNKNNDSLLLLTNTVDILFLAELKGTVLILSFISYLIC